MVRKNSEVSIRKGATQLNMYEEKHWNLVKNKWPEVKAVTF